LKSIFGCCSISGRYQVLDDTNVVSERFVYRTHVFDEAILSASFKSKGRRYNSLEGSVRAKFLEVCGCVSSRRRMRNPFRYFDSSPEVIRLAVMM